jgi:hypothetical protein
MEAAGYRTKPSVCTKLHGIMLQNITGLIFRLSPESNTSSQTFTSLIKKYDYGKFEFGAFQLGLKNLVTRHFEGTGGAICERVCTTRNVRQTSARYCIISFK